MSTGCCLGELLWNIEAAGDILPVTPSRCCGCAGAMMALLTASGPDEGRGQECAVPCLATKMRRMVRDVSRERRTSCRRVRLT